MDFFGISTRFYYLCPAKEQLKGTKAVPFFFFTMSTELITQLEKLVAELLQDAPEHFLVSLYIKPTHNIKLMLDGDKGITIEQCVRFNRKLVALIDEAGLFPPGEYSLEVSSPGVDEPLKLHRQFVKNIGRTVQVVLKNNASHIGILQEVTENNITLTYTEGKGKKAITQSVLIPFSEIHSVTVQIQF
ncbi:MAG: ribosome maturation factor [Chitinophagia bacterium]|jgi:ribosome maturation factor RimP